jgi:MtrB/PioB family decaheme-associated outer membrane protein
MNKKLICILVSNLFAVAPAFGQSDDFKVGGTVGVGGIAVDDNNAADASKLNEYRDMSNGVLTNFDVRGRSKTYWLDAFGENLGRDDQYLNVRGGMYDVFKYRIYSDELKHNFLFNGITPYANAGSSAVTATFPQLDPHTWNSIDIGYKRRDDGFHFEFQGVSPWYFRAEGNQVTWNGTKPGSSSQGTSPGNGFVDLSIPVDYKTKNATLEGGYDTRTMHFDLSWMTSKFENDNESITWTNGYFGNGTDRTYLAPDNKYTRFAGNATFRGLPWSTTVAARFTSDEMKSDATLGTSVLNTTTGGSALTGPNVDSFQGKIRNNTFTLAIASAPMKGLDTRAYLNYRKRDDDSTHVSYNSTDIPGPFENETFTFKKENYGFDVYYRLDRGNRFGGGWDYLDTKRQGRFDYDRTKDRRWFFEWKNSTFDDLAVRLKYTNLDRNSDFLLANEGTSSTDPAYENRYVTAFDLSNVNQDQWKLTLDYSPVDFVDLSFEGISKTNKYKDNVLGRLKDDRSEVYVSASYTVPLGIRLSVFLDAETIKYDSTHRIVANGSTLPGAYDPLAPPNSTNYNWSGNIKDRNSAYGIAMDLPVSDKLVFKASAIYYKTDGSVDLALQEGVPSSVVAPVPIATWDDSKRTSFNVKAVYALNKSWSLTGGYAYEKYEYKDSQYDGYRYTIPGSSNQNTYLDGAYAFQPYKANIFYGMATYHF